MKTTIATTTPNGERRNLTVEIKFESVSGQSLVRRFNTLAASYSVSLLQNPGDWVAEQFKNSLVSNIQRGTIIVNVDGKNVGMA